MAGSVVSANEMFELHIRVVEAKNLKRVIMLGHMDPVAIVRARDEQLRSPDATDSDMTPERGWKT